MMIVPLLIQAGSHISHRYFTTQLIKWSVDITSLCDFQKSANNNNLISSWLLCETEEHFNEWQVFYHKLVPERVVSDAAVPLIKENLRWILISVQKHILKSQHWARRKPSQKGREIVWVSVYTKMRMNVKVFLFALLVCIISAMPVDEQKVDAQVDLLAVESAPQSEIETAVNEDISRIKRQCEYR